MIPTRFTETSVGDMFVGWYKNIIWYWLGILIWKVIIRAVIFNFIEFIFSVRNAGNVIPHSQYFVDEMTSCEPAALELGCIINDIRHIIVCGHSDCKAMNLLYKLKSKEESSIVCIVCIFENTLVYITISTAWIVFCDTFQEQRRISPLKSWLCTHGQTSLDKFLDMNNDFTKPMLFTGETPQRKFVAYIDPENKFCIEDKLSQVPTNNHIIA